VSTAPLEQTAETSSDWFADVRKRLGESGEPQLARHPVNGPAIADWADAMGDDNPVYTDPEFAASSVHGGIVAPPVTLDIWDRPGLKATRSTEDPRGRALNALDNAGFVGVVAVNSELEIKRYLRPGDELQNVQILEDISEEKATGLGIGHFVTTRHRYTTADGEHVGDLLFRILKFKPGTGRTRPADPNAGPALDTSPSARPRPGINNDNLFFWEGCRKHELRMQRDPATGRLFHPPGPRQDPATGSWELQYEVCSGRGRLYSYAVPHYPQVPGFTYPVIVGLVELEEGPRLISNIVGVDRDDLEIGMPLEVTWLDSHPAQVEGATDSRGPITIPQFRPAAPQRRETTRSVDSVSAGEKLPTWIKDVEPTQIVSGALATRDFQEVHHDRDLAHARGSADIFLNINTSVGLMARYVGDWAGPEHIVTATRVRLGAPAYPYNALTFTGEVTEADAATGRVVVRVRARNILGDHLSGTVELLLPGDAGGTEYTAFTARHGQKDAK
jgi:uncharacterized OB-fold protein/acyl dehydratase